MKFTLASATVAVYLSSAVYAQSISLDAAASVNVGFGSFPTSLNYTCVDLAQTQCGNYGVKVKYPAVLNINYPFANVSAIDAFFETIYTAAEVQVNSQCGINNFDIQQGGQFTSFFCRSIWSSVFNPAANATAIVNCNGGAVTTVQQICRSECVRFYTEVTANLLKNQNCNNQTFISAYANATAAAETCSSYPTTDCAQLSSASLVTQSVMSMLVVLAVSSYLNFF